VDDGLHGGSGVDWVRYAAGILSRAADQVGAKWTGLGDPNRWGSDGSVRVPLALGQVGTEQLIRVQCIDPYSRNWQVIGNVAASVQLWNVSAANLSIGLEVVMGVGQSSVKHVFDLRAITDLAAPWYIVPNADSIVDADVITKPFVIAGGLVGTSIAARVVIVQAGVVVLEDPQTVRVVASTSPYSAGPM
jgi:hypothetical protein